MRRWNIASVSADAKGTQQAGWELDRSEDSPQANFMLAIEDTGSGFLLLYRRHDGALYADTWHGSLSEAMQCALEDFGVSAEQWLPAS